MVTEGILTSIDYLTNKCYVRIPSFESAGDIQKVIIEGRIAIQPGSYNGYIKNDPVWVTFVDDKLNQPLIIGKIYKDPSDENKTAGGHLNVTSLNVSGNAVNLPKETKINNLENKYNTFDKIVNELKNLSLNLTSLTKYSKNEINDLILNVLELNKSIDDLNSLMGTSLTDTEGNILADLDGNILTYQGAEVTRALTLNK